MATNFIELKYYDCPLDALKNEGHIVFLPISEIKKVEPVINAFGYFKPGELCVVSTDSCKYFLRGSAEDLFLGITTQVDSSYVFNIEFGVVGPFKGDVMRFISF